MPHNEKSIRKWIKIYDVHLGGDWQSKLICLTDTEKENVILLSSKDFSEITINPLIAINLL